MTTLQGRCESCGEVFGIRRLHLAFRPTGRREEGGWWYGRDNFALLCGPCLAAVLNPSGAESEAGVPSARREGEPHLGATTERQAS